MISKKFLHSGNLSNLKLIDFFMELAMRYNIFCYTCTSDPPFVLFGVYVNDAFQLHYQFLLYIGNIP